ncbi:MAG: hypothetical protein II008_06820 [Oscillospiraceae bacterium]|nr:hypothetical protein [Oscillospiraceae bacterium]
MSHYIVMAVIRNGAGINGYEGALESLLAPYDENKEVNPYIRSTRAQIIKEGRERCRQFADELKVAETIEGIDEKDCASKFREAMPDAPHRYQSVVDPTWGRRYAALAEGTDEEILALMNELEYDGRLDENGNYISTYNLNSKWDWYEVGGRWSGQLKLKKRITNAERQMYDLSSDSALATYIDWDAMFQLDPERKARLEEFWNLAVLRNLPEEAGQTEEERDRWVINNYGIFTNPAYYFETYGTLEEYLRRQAIWCPYAVVDEKGWYAPGEMGWFGCSSETSEQKKDWEENFRARFIDTLKPNDRIVMVDCHI